MGAQEARAASDSLLDRLGIGALADRLPHELSGGEEQRAGIARALVHGPRVILADEVTASLDFESGQSILSLLVSLAAERDAAVLFATHDLRLRRFASRSLFLSNGTVGEEAVH
jgi:putative ABC transport system ATP-binding protein